MRISKWVAALLSLLTVGAGQLYNGEWKKAGAAAAGAYVILPGLLVSGLVSSNPRLRVLALAVVLPAGIALLVWSIVDAFRGAKRRSGDAPVPFYSRWYTLAPVIGVVLFFIQPVEQEWARRSVGRAFWMPGASMTPTLPVGDYFFVQPLKPDDLRPGRLVSHRSLIHPEITVIKRIVGLPGDTIQMVKGVVFRNGRRVDEPYIEPNHGPDLPMEMDGEIGVRWHLDALASTADREEYRPTRDSWGPLVVPIGHFLTLGDNRDESLDSRFLGFVPERLLEGRPTWVYFSFDRAARRIRWSRLGKSLE